MSPSERMTARAVAASWLLNYANGKTAQWHPGSATFTRTLAAQAPDQHVARDVIAQLDRCPTTVMSRLMRAGLPTPKEQLAAFRLALALKLSRQPVSVSNVALDLNYSTPQSFGRHVRERFSLTAVEWFQRWTPERFLTEALDPLMAWDDARWLDLDVLNGRETMPYYQRPQQAVAELVVRSAPVLAKPRTCCPSCGRLLVKSA